MMQNLRRFWVYIRPDLWLFVLTLVLMPVQAGLGIAQPLVLKKILDEHLVAGKAEGLQSWALVWLGLAVPVLFLVTRFAAHTAGWLTLMYGMVGIVTFGVLQLVLAILVAARADKVWPAAAGPVSATLKIPLPTAAGAVRQARITATMSSRCTRFSRCSPEPPSTGRPSRS